MSWAEEMGYDCYDLDDLPRNQKRIDTIKVVENGYVINKEYCLKCGSIDIGVSQKGNKYCKKLCRVDKEK